METKYWLGAILSCLALTLWALPATAVPISIARTSPNLVSDGTSIVETTYWRRRDAYYYYSEHSPDDFDRYYPFDELDCSCSYPTYHYYYVYPRHRYYQHDHRHHRHHRHHRNYRRW